MSCANNTVLPIGVPLTFLQLETTRLNVRNSNKEIKFKQSSKVDSLWISASLSKDVLLDHSYLRSNENNTSLLF